MLTLLWGLACGTEPCEQYIDYMCECHPDDQDQSCDDLERQFGGASDPDLQDECTLALDEQEEEDEEEGLECEVDTTG